MKRTGLHILFTTVAFTLSSCYTVAVRNQKPVISVSILPQKYFIEKLAGDRIEVNVMIPPGASPATYEPTLSQLSKLDQSEVYMRIGYVEFELTWMGKIQSVNPTIKVIDLSKGMELIHENIENEEDHLGHDHGGIDPHIWMSVLNAKIIAINIYNELTRMLPDEEEHLNQRLKKFNYELDSMHHFFTERLKGVKQRSFLIYHPALTYFARDYNFIQYPLELGGKTPSPAHLKKTTDLAQEKNITSIFIQSQFDRRNAEIIASELDAEIIPFDPLDEDWKEQMFYIVEQLSRSL